MTTIFSRGVLTDFLLDKLATELTAPGILVGDGIAPEAGGWTGGQPGEGNFAPYVVLNTGPASKQGTRETLGNESTSWAATYTTRHVGALRQQADWAADKVRRVLNDFRLKAIDLDGDWRIMRTEYQQLGAVIRNDSTDPAYWEITDSLTLWLEAR